MLDKKAWQSIMYISIFFSWLLFIPFFGPGQYLLTTVVQASNVFIFAHIIGMLHCGWQYVWGKNETILRIVPKTAVLLIPISMLTAFLFESSVVDLSAFLVMGYASSWFIIRWAWWLSQPDYSRQRGLLMGIVIAATNILLFVYTRLLYFENSALVILVCSILSTAGAFLITTLPTVARSDSDTNIKEALPPWHLLIFAVFAFSGGGFLYAVVYTVELEFPSHLRSLTIFVYIIAVVVFGYLADKFSRVILLPSLFTVMGIGFVLLIINDGSVVIHRFLKSSILIGLGCADLYYWLTLASHGRRENIPFVFAVGLSFHLVVIVLTTVITECFLIDYSSWFSPIGIIGTITMFLGILFSFWIYKVYYVDAEKSVQGEAVSALLVNPLEDEIVEKFKLTPREKEITLLLLQGYSYPQISEQLFISLNTVKYHVRNILRKADVSNRHELIKLIREGD